MQETELTSTAATLRSGRSSRLPNGYYRYLNNGMYMGQEQGLIRCFHKTDQSDLTPEILGVLIFVPAHLLYLGIVEVCLSCLINSQILMY